MPLAETGSPFFVSYAQPFFFSFGTFSFFFFLVSKYFSFRRQAKQRGKREVIERNLMSSYVGVPWVVFCNLGVVDRVWLYCLVVSFFCLMSSSITLPFSLLLLLHLLLLRYPFLRTFVPSTRGSGIGEGRCPLLPSSFYLLI